MKRKLEDRVKEEEGGGRSTSLIIIEAGNGGKRLGTSDRSETSMLFWVILSHIGRRTYYPLLMVVGCVIYVINLVLPVIYMVSIGHLQGGTRKTCLSKRFRYIYFFYTSLIFC